jgi:hypothetical protein
MTDLCHLPAYELVPLTSSRAVSCRDVVEAYGLPVVIKDVMKVAALVAAGGAALS